MDKVKQYCRYCTYALDYNGEGVDYICDAKAPCGNNGAGCFYPAQRGKRINKCKYFCFNQNDVFGYMPNGDFKTYQPRGKKQAKQGQEDAEQMELT